MQHGDLSNICNVFVKQVCEAWFTYNFNVPNADFHNQIVLNNSLVKIEHRTFFNHYLFNAGAYRVHDFFNHDGSTKDYQTFVSEFKLIAFPFTIYFGILSSMPSTWKAYLHTNDTTTISVNANELRLLLFNSKSSANRNIYSSLLQNHLCIPSCVKKWEAEFSCELYWNKIFLLPFKSVKHSKLQYFQYRFVHRILAVNNFLFKIGLVDSLLCTFCGMCEETLSHLFWECPISISFLSEAVNYTINSDVALTKEVVFFGDLGIISSPFNFFMIHAKNYIYACRVKKSLPQLNHFQRVLSLNLKVEFFYG